MLSFDFMKNGGEPLILGKTMHFIRSFIQFSHFSKHHLAIAMGIWTLAGKMTSFRFLEHVFCALGFGFGLGLELGLGLGLELELGLRLRLVLAEIRLNTFSVKHPFRQVYYIPRKGCDIKFSSLSSQ